MRWHSYHVFYHDDQTPLILDAVRPLFRRLDGDVGALSYLRHWRRGPHVRLNVRCTDETGRDVVAPAVHEVVGGYLAERPSTARLDPAALLPEHRRLARQELDPGPIRPWCADNSIHPAPFEDRSHVLGGPEAAEMLAGFYADTTDLAFAMTETVAAGGGKRALAFDLMAATAHALSGIGLWEGFVSYRSHAEAFLSRSPAGARLRERWDAQYERHAEALTERVRTLVAGLDRPPGRVPYVGEWAEILGRYRRRGLRLIAGGRLTMDPPVFGDAEEEARAARGVAEMSDFHRALLASESWPKTLSADWFTAYRLMLNYTYLHLTRLGMTPMERYLVCHLLARAVEECYGVSAMELIGRAEPPALLPVSARSADDR